MSLKNGKSTSDFRMSLHGLPYDQTVPAKPPVKIATASSRHGDTDTHPPAATQAPTSSVNFTPPEDTSQRDVQHVGRQTTDPLLLAASSTRDSQSSFATNERAPSSLASAPSIPQIRVDDGAPSLSKSEENTRRWLSLKPTRSKTEDGTEPRSPSTQDTFSALTLDLPGGGLGDELQTRNMKFSQRGSMLLDGRKVSPSGPISVAALRPVTGTKRIPTSSSVPERPPPRIMSTDEEMLSEKVRLFYAIGTDTATSDADDNSVLAKKMNLRWQDALQDENDSVRSASRAPSTREMTPLNSPGIKPVTDMPITREDNELAGGLEDWQDIENAYVDRYGFIVPKSPPSPAASEILSVKRSSTSKGPSLQRVSTSLQLAADTPRRKHAIHRSPSSARSDRGKRSPRKESSYSDHEAHFKRPASSKSTTMHRNTTLRVASNRLPGYKDRRLMDEAGDMLTLPRSLTTQSLSRSSAPTSDAQSTTTNSQTASRATSVAGRKKELEREEKWRKMARPVSSSAKTHGVGGGMLFEFPSLTDPKLVSRTWKGIPDAWRSAAWHYFLSISARKNPHSLSDEKLMNLFHEYQHQNSPDDVQIDIDVPRTISSHIMFRRRYRGGQRLLFRVLHAMSLHFTETGYVQGMAALVATLLAYYEEEKAFVMLVRVWDTRGLGRLYQSGFGGLMEALDNFEKGWLGSGEVAKKLEELNVGPTAYGTKWYLTLFNYSIPFPAQLRVWDVFMLLGDDESTANHQPSADREEHPPFGTTLDVLHATSAALIDGMRDILLESDFENAMKVLTSWIPIRDEDLFMRVAKAEWKMHRKKA